MRKLFLLMIALSFVIILNAQPWQVQMQQVSGNSKVKTLRLKPEMRLEIGRLLNDNDTLKEYNYYNGIFLGGTADSIRIRLNEVKINSVFTNGIKHQSTIPVKYFTSEALRDSGFMSFALPEIDYLKFRPAKKNEFGGFVEPTIYLSLLTLFLSPIISYNFKEGELNAERYKYWALGSTLVLASCITAIITINAIHGPDTFRFKAGWPGTHIKQWRFINQPDIR
ncbi:hypothetical protein TBC1_112038 [Lentimicrobium saccharophilum]|uniref:Uncharacterized protein n=1 Tax=Lentimicrobium saccharophilum TaxID=1678841 RepID=A0A0S7C465_9BACT|nr:hypothetical protein [Lentimicrobium saccharophilum]GAP43880.1 hypothetical protein TBC1_112038 [Lentimicrobium saccharophilum]